MGCLHQGHGSHQVRQNVHRLGQGVQTLIARVLQAQVALGHAEDKIGLFGRVGGELGHAAQLRCRPALLGFVADLQAHPRQAGQGLAHALPGLLDPVIERRRARDITQILLGGRPGAQQQVSHPRRIVGSAKLIGRTGHRFEVTAGLAQLGRQGTRLRVRGGTVGHLLDDLEQGVQGLAPTVELVQNLSQLAHHHRFFHGQIRCRPPFLQQPEQDLALAGGEQGSLHAASLGGIVLGARQGRLERLGSGVLAAQGQGHATQAQEDLAGGDRGICRLTPAGQYQQGSVGLLRAVELAQFLGHLGQGELDVHVVEQYRGGLFQVLQGQLGILLCARHLCDLMVQHGPLARLAAAVLFQHAFQGRARIGQATRPAQAIGQGEAQAAISRRQGQRPFQDRHRALGAVQVLLADRQGFMRAGHHRVGIDQLGAAIGESPDQRLPALGIPVQLGEQHPELVGGRVFSHGALERGHRPVVLAGRHVGAGQLRR